MNLEDFRDQQFVGESVLMSPYFNGNHLPFLFHETSNAAFYMTIDALNRMQSHDSIGGNGYCLPGIGLWFQATESYLSTIYKLAVAESNNSRRSISAVKKLMEKLDQINQYFSISVSPTLRNQLQEFITFRNGIFHDLTLVRNTRYSHTLFSPKPEKLNEIDLFQSAAVAVRMFTYYRYLFKDVDLMPQIFINNQFDDLDRLANEILYPALKEILKLKGLGTALDLTTSSIHCDPRDYDVRVKAIISYSGPSYPNCGATSSPSVVQKYYKEASNSRPMDPENFGIPNYTRNKMPPAFKPMPKP
ncbi:MAG: hypothetical protein AB7G68_19170 [Nitrospiraceae bacterium]